MIEESYLLSLSESEIRMDLERFVEMCSRVISENIHDKKQMQKLSEKLARARALDRSMRSRKNGRASLDKQRERNTVAGYCRTHHIPLR